MKRILVATDFSRASRSALDYGNRLAELLSAKLEVVHVLDATATQTKLKNWKKLEMQMVESANASAASAIKFIPKSVEVTFTLLKGQAFAAAVSDKATKSKADIVIVGSRGMSKVQKAVLGSSSASLLRACPVPVIVVPEGSRFNGIRKIVYASDMVRLDDEVKSIAAFAKYFNAEIVVLHVVKEGTPRRDRSRLTEILIRIARYRHIKIEVRESGDVTEGIESYVNEEKPDLLAMFTHKTSFFERTFGKSITRKMAFHSTLPLLSIQRAAKGKGAKKGPRKQQSITV